MREHALVAFFYDKSCQGDDDDDIKRKNSFCFPSSSA